MNTSIFHCKYQKKHPSKSKWQFSGSAWKPFLGISDAFPKCLLEALWKVIWGIPGPSLPNGSEDASGSPICMFQAWWLNVIQEASGDSLWAFLDRLIFSISGPCVLAKLRNVHFENFWALMAKWLSRGVWGFILSISGFWWPNGPQEATNDITFQITSVPRVMFRVPPLGN